MPQILWLLNHRVGGIAALNFEAGATDDICDVPDRPPRYKARLSSVMTSYKGEKPQGLSRELKEPIRAHGTFEDIPVIARVAGNHPGRRLEGKVCVVTGANSPLGIGRAAAHQFAINAAHAVYICDYNDDHLDQHKRELNKLYPEVRIHTKHFDATEESEVESFCAEVLKTYGRLDIFFANAGIGGAAPFWDIDAEQFMNNVKGNLLSAFLCAKFASKAMLMTSASKPYPQGSIVVTASVAGIRSNAGSTDYSAGKAGVISLAQTMSFQLSGTGVRVNAVCPGIIETGMTSLMYEYARSKGTESKIGQLNPTRRGGVADEIARVAVFLGSDESSYVNGQAWAVDGGLSAGHPFVPGKLA